MNNYLINIRTVIDVTEHRETKYNGQVEYDIQIHNFSKEQHENDLSKFRVGEIIGVNYNGKFHTREIVSITLKKGYGEGNNDIVTLTAKLHA